MYSWTTHTWNPISGECPHKCPYCYMRKFKLKPLHLKDGEIASDVDQGCGKVIFVGSGTDMFCDAVKSEWIEQVVAFTKRHPNNRYVFQTKNPRRYAEFGFPEKTLLGTTIETDRIVKGCMAPYAVYRAIELGKAGKRGYKTFVTIEPIIAFRHDIMVGLIEMAKPSWVNIGADSKASGLEEPTKEAVDKLVAVLKTMTRVAVKANMGRLVEG